MKTYLGIDYGEKRIGLALGNSSAKIATAFKTIPNEDAVNVLRTVCDQNQVDELILGKPLGLNGEGTAQTLVIDEFKSKLESAGLPIQVQHEDATSEIAEAELKENKKSYEKSDVDMHAARIILQDYLDALV